MGGFKFIKSVTPELLYIIMNVVPDIEKKIPDKNNIKRNPRIPADTF